MKRDIRGYLVIKILAIVLLVLTSVGAALSTCGLALLSQGYGVIGQGSFYDDPLCMIPLNDAMDNALYYHTERDAESGAYYHYERKLERHYQGFACKIYAGDPADGVLFGTWGEVTSDHVLRHTKEVETTLVDSGYFTIEGYLSEPQMYGSEFQIGMRIFYLLNPFRDGTSLIVLTVVLYLFALVALIFLLCSAGHRRDKKGIFPNWQDRIPLDLYLVAVFFTFSCVVAFAIECVDNYYGFTSILLLDLSFFALCILVDGLMVLATLMTLATRFKLGKWWRNTICYKLLRWLIRICKVCWTHLLGFLHILPFTWRTVLLVVAVLGMQTFLTLLMFESYNGGFFFLVALLLDAVLLVAAAWLSRQLQMLQTAAKSLAEGDLEAKADTRKMYFSCRQHAEHLNAIGVGMTRAVEQRIKSERLKTELITNVSHDIKTPLTSIVNYVDLLKKEELPEKAGAYVAVLDRQSRRLKKLTEDLVEASKASTGNIAVKLEPILVNEIIHQAIGDYNEKLTAGKLEVIVNTYSGNINAIADGRLLWRVLDNLLSNVCKYALPGTRVYMELENRDNRVYLTMKNISRDPLHGKAEELVERFVRGDDSRHTEGSGLGLNIAQSLMELMGGTFQISVDGDLFKAELSLSVQ